MKKLIASILLAALVVCACACGETADSTGSKASTADTSSAAVTSTVTSAPNDNDAQINAGELEDDTSSTFSIVVGPGEDESGWSEIF